MGLIRNAEIKKSYNPESIKSKKKNGLLDRIVSLSPYDTLKRLFLDVLSEAHCDKGFLLYPAGDRYQVVLENGFDLTSSTRMMPELSSFDALCSTTDVIRFSGRDLQLFSSFFSTRERSGLVELAVYPLPFGQNTAYILFAQSNIAVERAPLSPESASSSLRSMQHFLEGNKALFAALSSVDNPVSHSITEVSKIRTAFEDKRIALGLSVSFAKAFPDRAHIDTDYNEYILYRAIVNKIARQAGPASIVRKNNDYSLRILVFVASGTDSSLYCNQMNKTLEKLFGAARVAAISLVFDGSFRNPDQAKGFLDGVI